MAHQLTGSTIASTFEQLIYRSTTEPSTGTTTQLLTSENDQTDDVGLPLYISTERVGIGTATPNTELEVSGAGGNIIAQISCHSDTEAHAPYLLFSKSDNTEASPHVVIENETLGILQFTGYDGDQYVSGAEIIARTAATPGNNDMPCDLEFWTNDGVAAPEQRMTILDSGNVGIGHDVPTDMLHIYRNDSSTNSMVKIEQDGTGDATLQFLTTSAQAWSIGIDNGATDDFVMASSAALETTPRVTILSASGNVGIGTTTPYTQLEIAHATNPVMSLHREDADVNNNDSLGILGFTGADPSGTVYGAMIKAIAKDDWGSGDSPAEMQFYVSPDGGTITKGMVIASTGYVGINEGSPSFRLDITESRATNYVARITNSNTTAQKCLLLNLSGEDLADDSGTDESFIDCTDSNSTNFQVFGDGDTISTEGAHVSDKRIKKDIVDATSKLDDINKLKVRNFKFTNGTKKRIGLIADELEEVFPALIKERKIKKYGVEYDDLKTITHTPLIPILVKAIQELSAKVTALENV